MAEDPKIMDSAWSTFLSCAHLADEIPVESRQAILDCGYTFWTQLDQLNTTRCAVLFNKQLGVPMVSSFFTFYRDAFLFAMAYLSGTSCSGAPACAASAPPSPRCPSVGPWGPADDRWGEPEVPASAFGRAARCMRFTKPKAAGKSAHRHSQLSAHFRGHAGGARGASVHLDQRGAPLRSRNSGDLINCSRPPKTPCKVCGHAH